MWTENAQRIGITPNKLVAAVFLDETAARDAIADLKLAGFTAWILGFAVLVGVSGRTRIRRGSIVCGGGCGIVSSRICRCRGLRFLPVSIGRQAANQEDVPYTELDLREAMQGLGMPADTIQLVHDEVGPDGLLIFVAAGYERQREVESILERDRGILRTSMATEPGGTAPVVKVAS